jgi:hypothetical protein
MARRLWSALLLACLFSNIASAQILARPDLDNQVRCFDHVWRDARNAVQAYQIVYAPGWKDEVACHGKVPAPDLEPCWPPVLQARPLVEQAATLFERARHAYAPEQGLLVAQANALIRQAAGLLDQGASASSRSSPAGNRTAADTSHSSARARKRTLPCLPRLGMGNRDFGCTTSCSVTGILM